MMSFVDVSLYMTLAALSLFPEFNNGVSSYINCCKFNSSLLNSVILQLEAHSEEKRSY